MAKCEELCIACELPLRAYETGKPKVRFCDNRRCPRFRKRNPLDTIERDEVVVVFVEGGVVTGVNIVSKKDGNNHFRSVFHTVIDHDHDGAETCKCDLSTDEHCRHG